VIWLVGLATLTGGLSLYAFARRADMSFAWTIKAPITAAFIGAGYWSATVGLALAAMTREWQRVRIVFVVGVALTTLMLVPTFIYLDQFHLDEGTAAQKELAWFWLVLYLSLPLILATAFARQERAGGRDEYEVDEPLLDGFRLVLVAHALGFIAVAVALWPVRADGFWPWPLPDLGAAVMAVWLAMFAVGAAWCLRERDWRRCRVVFAAFLTFLVLLLVAAAWFSDAFDGGAWQTWTWLGAIVLSLLLLGGGALQQERIARGRAPVPAAGGATRLA
jgi:hypothetical protein